MKRIMLVLAMSVMLVGCGSDSEQVEEELPEKEVLEVEEAKEEAKDEAKASDEVPIRPEDVEMEISFAEPDSIGNVYAEASFTNNTEYPIIGYSATMLRKDENEKSTLTTYDTVMPGETSPIFEAFGPKSQSMDDYELLTLDVVALLDNGNELHIDYDFKLGTAGWDEYEKN